MFFLIVGLGNPGREYADSRHNAGFRCLDALAEQAGASFAEAPALRAALAAARLGDQEIVLLKPLTFMNRSGHAVAAFCAQQAVPLERLLVVHDDMDLELGRIQLRPGGGDGGHRGVRSLGEELGSLGFPRMRLGVGRPGDALDNAVEHVLGIFAPEERPLFAAMLARATQALAAFVAAGLTPAMNRFNPWPLRPTEETPSDGEPDARSGASGKRGAADPPDPPHVTHSLLPGTRPGGSSQKEAPMDQVREYETLYILRPDLTDEAALQINDRMKGVLDREGARLLKCQVWGKRKTAFEVKKQPKGIYVQLCFLSPPHIVREVERNLRMLEPVIRFQTIKLAENVDVDKRLAEQEAENRAAAEAEAKARAEAEARQAAGLPATEPAAEPALVEAEGDEDGFAARRGRSHRDDEDADERDEPRHKDRDEE